MTHRPIETGPGGEDMGSRGLRSWEAAGEVCPTAKRERPLKGQCVKECTSAGEVPIVRPGASDLEILSLTDVPPVGGLREELGVHRHGRRRGVRGRYGDVA